MFCMLVLQKQRMYKIWIGKAKDTLMVMHVCLFVCLCSSCSTTTYSVEYSNHRPTYDHWIFFPKIIILNEPNGFKVSVNARFIIGTPVPSELFVFFIVILAFVSFYLCMGLNFLIRCGITIH